MYTTHANRKSFTTLDGAELSYLEAGEGQTMVMVHGWSQSARSMSTQNHIVSSPSISAGMESLPKSIMAIACIN